MKLLTLLVLTLLSVSSSFGGPLSRSEIAQPRASSDIYRLPTNVKPIKYNIELTPDIENAKFSGKVTITIKVLEEDTKKITLHQRELEILKEDITVSSIPSGDNVVVTSVEYINTVDQEFFEINLQSALKINTEYFLTISKFTGILNDKKKGFYLAEYVDENGKTRKFATTQFEPTAARQAFPCFDEPALKAKFKITLVRPNKNYNSVANTPMVGTTVRKTKDDEELVDEFQETVEMSTYLIAFIVSEMNRSEKGRQGVIAKPQAITDNNHIYALEKGEEILVAIEKFVGIDYLLKKMDQAAIPDDYFSAGAMENWGLVTYRESYLLKSDKTTTSSMHQSIATIIAHEFGHQWFGNLVSPEWWTYIWLNEGFATYFEYFAASIAEEKMRIMDQFVVKNTQFAFQPDSLESTRPMNHDAGSPNEISALFDRIAYEKSGSVIRMMEAFLTTPVFKKGLNYYLSEMEHGAAVPEKLYQNLQKAVDEDTLTLPKDVSEIMTTWHSLKGYPVVNVLRDYSDKKETVSLNQSRFLLTSSTASDDSVWYIPLNFATKSKSSFDDTGAEYWLTNKKETTNIKGLSSEDWLILNKQETGYYRVNYDEKNWELLTDALIEDHTKVHLLNRAQLIDDSFNLARSGRLSYSIPLRLSLHLSKETDYIPLYSFFNAATFLNQMVSGTTAHDSFKAHVIDILTVVYEKLGFNEKENDAHLDKLNRVSVLNWLCNMGHSECRTKSLETFQTWKNNEESSIPLNLQTPVFCGAMRGANEREWDFLYTQYEKAIKTTDGALQSRILNGLGCSEDTEILKQFLAKVIVGDNNIKPENGFAVVYNSGPVGVEVAFEYVSAHFQYLHSKLVGNSLKAILNGIGAKLTTSEQLTTLQELSKENSEQEDLFKTAIANAEKNVNWNEDNLSDITSWLNKDSEPDSVSNVRSSVYVITLSYLMLQVVKLYTVT